MWVCLFTCLVTRATHLKLLEDMFMERFLMGLRRFIVCRGSIKLYQTMKDSSNLLLKQSTNYRLRYGLKQMLYLMQAQRKLKEMNH